MQARQGSVWLAIYSQLTGQSLGSHNVWGMTRLIRVMRCDGMRKLFALVLVMLAGPLVPCSRAQYSVPAELGGGRQKDKDLGQEELVNLEKETARALLSNSGMLFRRVYGDDFVGILPSGQILDKAAWIASIEDLSTKYSSFVATDIRVRVIQDTAVVTCLWSSHGTKNGKAFFQQLRVTHVYVYGQRGWQVIASQETLLPG